MSGCRMVSPAARSSASPTRGARNHVGGASDSAPRGSHVLLAKKRHIARPAAVDVRRKQLACKQRGGRPGGGVEGRSPCKLQKEVVSEPQVISVTPGPHDAAPAGSRSRGLRLTSGAPRLVAAGPGGRRRMAPRGGQGAGVAPPATCERTNRRLVTGSRPLSKA